MMVRLAQALFIYQETKYYLVGIFDMMVRLARIVAAISSQSSYRYNGLPNAKRCYYWKLDFSCRNDK